MLDGIQQLPHFHATMNLCATVCQLLGWRAIRQQQESLHARWMIVAFGFSTFFLASYLTYHFLGDPRVYTGPGRPLYLAILVSHIILAIVVVPMVLRAFYLAFRKRLAEHVAFARWALAVWLYVSMTGVLIYLLVFYV